MIVLYDVYNVLGSRTRVHNVQNTNSQLPIPNTAHVDLSRTRLGLPTYGASCSVHPWGKSQIKTIKYELVHDACLKLLLKRLGSSIELRQQLLLFRRQFSAFCREWLLPC